MKCECREDLEAKLLERFISTEPDGSGHQVTIEGYAFGIVGDQMVMVGTMPIKATATVPLKKGGSKVKTVRQAMHFSFCPFCGVEA